VKSAFPRKATLWRGAILGGIVNATLTAEHANYAYARQWIRNHYVLNGGDGREGTVTFAGGHWFADGPLVGVFYNVHTERFRGEKEPDLERFFRGCPVYQRSLAEQFALGHLRLEFRGELLHRVTAAFWDDGECLFAPDSWDQLLGDGVNLIEEVLAEDPEHAFAQLQNSFQASSEQIAFAKSLFERKIARPPAVIELTASDFRFLESTFVDPKVTYAQMEQWEQPDKPSESKTEATPKWWETIDSAAEAKKAMKLCRELFAEIGILVP
jgi:hypothetical protein